MINSEYLVIFGQVHTPTHFASFASHVYSASRAITTTNKEGGWKKKCTICDFFSSGFLHCRYFLLFFQDFYTEDICNFFSSGFLHCRYLEKKCTICNFFSSGFLLCRYLQLFFLRISTL